MMNLMPRGSCFGVFFFCGGKGVMDIRRHGGARNALPRAMERKRNPGTAVAHGHVCRVRGKMNGRAFKGSSIK